MYICLFRMSLNLILLFIIEERMINMKLQYTINKGNLEKGHIFIHNRFLGARIRLFSNLRLS